MCERTSSSSYPKPCQITAGGDYSHRLEDSCSLEEKLWQIWTVRHHFSDKGLYSQSYGFSSNHVWVWESVHKDGWEMNNWCFQVTVLTKILESPLDCKEIKPVNLKGNQPWIFVGRTDAEASILWPSDAKSWLIGKDPDSGKYWGQGEKGVTEDEMVGWLYWLNWHESE